MFTYERGTPVTAVALAQDANTVFVGGIDNEVAVFDVRKDHEQVYSLKGHSDTVTCARLSPDGSYLLTNGMDSTVRVWDVRPYAPMERCLKIFMGAQVPENRFVARASCAAWSLIRVSLGGLCRGCCCSTTLRRT